MGRSSLAFGLLVLVGGLGCQDAAPAVNRVQPNVVDKGTFEGEWYFLQTVIDTPYGASYAFVGEQSYSPEKVRWEIQEHYLIARRSYDRIAGAEPEGLAGATESGAPIAMWAIESHFDIKREYNPVTGEEINVVGENAVDRPWNERAYMRVDWSKNLLSDANFLLLARLFGGIIPEPVAYYVQNLEPGHPHRPKFESRPGESEVSYVDIVNKVFVQPTTTYLEGYGDVPACLLLFHNADDCASGEITVRNSFMKMDPTRDYQPLLYTGDRMEHFGYFVTERPGYDEEYGLVEPERYRFANRHNLWMQSHKRAEGGELLRCTAANAAEVCGGGGSECDLDLARAERRRTAGGALEGACTIPYRERATRPITYYVSKNYPADLVADAEHMGREWSRAFRDTVASLRENECLADGGDAADCAEERERPDAENLFIVCGNPVDEEDEEACGPVGTEAEIGDLRYNLLGWVSEPHVFSPLGYGPSLADPETGEIVHANAFMYGAAVETYASYGRDMVALLNGDVDLDDVSGGETVRAWVERQEAPGSVTTGRPASDHAVPVDGFDAADVNRAMDFSWATDLGSGAPPARPANAREFFDAFEASLGALYRGGAFGPGEDRASARLGSLVGTDVEQLMAHPELRFAAGVDPRVPVSEELLERVSPLRGMNPRRILALSRARDLIQKQGCLLEADFAEEGLLGLARAIKRAAETGDGTMDWYGKEYQLRNDDGSLDYAAVRDMLRHPMTHGLVLHEVGHTIGLRHNFSGSFDAWNFPARYWELRDDGDMAPRAWDPMTTAELDGRIREYQYSTVMDYGNNYVVSDAHGIGHYDVAAVKMGYGDLVEVFTSAGENTGEINWLHAIQTAGWPTRLRGTIFTTGVVEAYAYTELPALVGGPEGLEERADVPYTSLLPDVLVSSLGIGWNFEDPAGRPMVPYQFCSDEQADLGPDCQRWDAGADAYEAIQSVIDQYWNYYVLNAFRRERLGFNPETYASRIFERYLLRMQRANQLYSLYRAVIQDMFGLDPRLSEFWTSPEGMGEWTAGVGAALSLLTKIIATPEPGGYDLATQPDGTLAYDLVNNPAFADIRVDALDGRYLETTWDPIADGYFWFDQVERVGYHYDKLLATWILVDPETHFLGRDTAADLRRYQISFHTTFPEAVTTYMRGLLAQDWHAIGARPIDGGGLEYPAPLDLVEQAMDGDPLDPAASFTVQLYAAVLGMSMIPDTFDQSYTNSARIFVEGGAEGVELDPSMPTVEFTDPSSGLTYVAASYLDGDGREQGVGAQMLNHAQALADEGSGADLARYLDNINVVRRLSWLFGYGG